MASIIADKIIRSALSTEKGFAQREAPFLVRYTYEPTLLLRPRVDLEDGCLSFDPFFGNEDLANLFFGRQVIHGSRTISSKIIIRPRAPKHIHIFIFSTTPFVACGVSVSSPEIRGHFENILQLGKQWVVLSCWIYRANGRELTAMNRGLTVLAAKKRKAGLLIA